MRNTSTFLDEADQQLLGLCKRSFFSAVRPFIHSQADLWVTELLGKIPPDFQKTLFYYFMCIQKTVVLFFLFFFCWFSCLTSPFFGRHNQNRVSFNLLTVFTFVQINVHLLDDEASHFVAFY